MLFILTFFIYRTSVGLQMKMLLYSLASLEDRNNQANLSSFEEGLPEKSHFTPLLSFLFLAWNMIVTAGA